MACAGLRASPLLERMAARAWWCSRGTPSMNTGAREASKGKAARIQTLQANIGAQAGYAATQHDMLKDTASCQGSTACCSYGGSSKQRSADLGGSSPFTRPRSSLRIAGTASVRMRRCSRSAQGNTARGWSSTIKVCYAKEAGCLFRVALVTRTSRRRSGRQSGR